MNADKSKKNQSTGGLRSYLEKELNQQAIQTALKQRLDEQLQNDKIQKIIDTQLQEKLPKIVEEKIEKAAPAIKEAVKQDTKKIADESLEELRLKIEKDRLNVVQVTSIITVFIGFLVVQFNILEGNKKTTEVAGLSLVLLSSIIIFVLLIDLVIKMDLPFRKSVEKKGLLYINLPITNRIEEVALTWRPSTWGEGIKLRVVALLLSTVIGALGVWLITL